MLLQSIMIKNCYFLVLCKIATLSLCSSCYIFANCFCPAGRKTLFSNSTRPERQIHFADLQFVQIHIMWTIAYMCNLDKYIFVIWTNKYLKFGQIHFHNLVHCIFAIALALQAGKLFCSTWLKRQIHIWQAAKLFLL